MYMCFYVQGLVERVLHEIQETCNSVTFYFMKNSFSNIDRKCILPNKIVAVTAPIMFGKIHFLLMPENHLFIEIKCNGITSFMEFVFT